MPFPLHGGPSWKRTGKSMHALLSHWLARNQALIVVVIAYQLYLAVSTELVDTTLQGLERVGSWPVQVLNIGLFVLVLFICWLYLRSTREDLQKLQKINEDERREFVESLKTLVGDTGKVIERNNVIFERIDKRLERLERRTPE
jgi:hypothetical protein